MITFYVIFFSSISLEHEGMSSLFLKIHFFSCWTPHLSLYYRKRLFRGRKSVSTCNPCLCLLPVNLTKVRSLPPNFLSFYFVFFLYLLTLFLHLNSAPGELSIFGFLAFLSCLNGTQLLNSFQLNPASTLHHFSWTVHKTELSRLSPPAAEKQSSRLLSDFPLP